MPRRIPQVLAFGLGFIAGGIGLLFLIGLWIGTSREIALWEALGGKTSAAGASMTDFMWGGCMGFWGAS